MKTDIYELVSRNLERLQPYLKQNEIGAYRLINNTQRDLPLSLDIYQDNAVVQVFNPLAPGLTAELQEALSKIIPVKDFFYKNKTRADLVLPGSPPKKIVQSEYGNQFLVDLSDYLDVGLFLDHRETRRWIAARSRGKVILNTFAYSGSFTVYAAAAGAAKTYSVDISRVYCQWIKDNLELNRLSPENNWVSKMDTLEFFQYAKRKKLVFDIIIIDPPTFSKSKNGAFSVQKDHPRLINAALEILEPSGFILFSNNYQEFRISQKDLQPCLVKEKLDTIPPDFAGTRPHRCFLISKQKMPD